MKVNGNVLNGRWVFIQEFLKHPLQVGSVVPSSRFLERRIVAAARIPSAELVVELGPGTGGTTRAILRAMPPSARLLCIETNPCLHALVDRIDDDRLIAHLGSACELQEIIARYGLGGVDAVVSGIPFSTMSRSAGSRIVSEISSCLVQNGRFVAYQASSRVATLTRPILGPARSATELLNIPPMRVFQWESSGG